MFEMNKEFIQLRPFFIKKTSCNSFPCICIMQQELFSKKNKIAIKLINESLSTTDKNKLHFRKFAKNYAISDK